MSFWITASFMAISAMTIVYVFANRFRDTLPPGEAGHDRALYQARLAEIKQDLSIGRLDKQTSQAARIEEARKLIRLENDLTPTRKSPGSRLHPVILFCAIMFVPLFSFGFYLVVETPPHVNTAAIDNKALDGADQPIGTLVQAVESRLAANPSDAAGWAVIAPVYLRMKRTAEAISAYRNALRLAGRQPVLVAGLGEALVIASDGIVTDEALAIFQETLALQPKHISARFYLGLAKVQTGDTQGAREIWRVLIAQASGDEVWLADLNRRLASLDSSNSLAGTPIPGVGEMNAAERTEMINDMVASLAQRLEDDPDDRAGWERLIRSYLVLEDLEKARRAIATARSHFADDLAFIEELEKLEASLEPRS